MAGIQHKRTWAVARLDGDTVHVTIYGQAEFLDERTVTASLDVTDDGGHILDALVALIEKHESAILQKTYEAAARSFVVALDQTKGGV